MAYLRSARLEAVLGAALDTVTPADVHRLIDGQVPEAFDLDFKSTLYGNTDKDKRDLAADVAALANNAGGLIVVGIEESNGRAVAAPGVAVTDAEVGRMSQIIASLVAPLPAFDVLPVFGESGANGFILVAVARSALAPHAVLVNNETLRYPVRNGTTTRYLSEPEVAAAYRERATTAAERLDRAAALENEIAARLGEESAWLVVTCVPELAGNLSITRSTFTAFDSEVRGRLMHPLARGAQFHQVGVGFERLTVSGTLRESDPHDWGVSAALYTDGSGVVATQLWDIRRGVQPHDGSHTISDEALAASLVGSLQFLGSHARDRARAGGVCIVRARVATSPVVGNTYLGHVRTSFPDAFGRPISDWTPPATAYALIDDLADDGTPLIVAAQRLHVTLGHAFAVPELIQFTDDGKIRRPYWANVERSAVLAWADANGVEIDDSTVP